MQQPDSSTTLFWSIRGEVACANHAPHPAAERWTSEGWARMPDTSVMDSRGQTRYQCQWCAESGRALIDHPESAKPLH
jgi:hypothetical protein